MYTFILTIHVIAVILLIAIILIQQGRGGGLIEIFSGAESIFGTKTSSFLVRTTAVLACLFFLTSLSLAWFSKRETKSVVEKIEQKKRPQGINLFEGVSPKEEKTQDTGVEEEEAKPDNTAPGIEPSRKFTSPEESEGK